jgi:thiol:disulfide interchange protein
MGLLATWIVYIILGTVFLMALIGLILFIVMMNATFSGVSASTNQPIKFFGIVLTSTVLTSTGILLSCFCIQHAKEAGWLPSPESPAEKEDEQNLAQNAKINALYSIDPGLQNPQTPVTPSMVNPRAPLIVY